MGKARSQDSKTIGFGNSRPCSRRVSCDNVWHCLLMCFPSRPVMPVRRCTHLCFILMILHVSSDHRRSHWPELLHSCQRGLDPHEPWFGGSEKYHVASICILSISFPCFRDFLFLFCLILILEGLYVLSSVRLHFQGATGQWQESITWLAKVETSFAHVKPQYKVQSNTAYTTYTCKYVIIRYHTSILSRILLAQVQAERMEASYST